MKPETNWCVYCGKDSEHGLPTCWEHRTLIPLDPYATASKPRRAQ